MHISPTTAAILSALFNATIFLVLYLIVRRAIVSQTKAKVFGAILKKCRDIENQIQADKEGGHYARLRNERRAYAIDRLSELVKEINR